MPDSREPHVPAGEGSSWKLPAGGQTVQNVQRCLRRVSILSLQFRVAVGFGGVRCLGIPSERDCACVDRPSAPRSRTVVVSPSVSPRLELIVWLIIA